MELLLGKRSPGCPWTRISWNGENSSAPQQSLGGPEPWVDKREPLMFQVGGTDSVYVEQHHLPPLGAPLQPLRPGLSGPPGAKLNSSAPPASSGLICRR